MKKHDRKTDGYSVLPSCAGWFCSCIRYFSGLAGICENHKKWITDHTGGDQKGKPGNIGEKAQTGNKAGNWSWGLGEIYKTAGK